jgi:hypothetical protein
LSRSGRWKQVLPEDSYIVLDLALDDDLKVEPGHKDEEDMVVTVGPVGPIGIPGRPS